MFQWVAPDGTCANGHPAEFLSAHHEVGVSGPPPDVTPIVPVEPRPPLDSAFPDAELPAAIPAATSSPAEPAPLDGFLVPDATHHMWRRTAAFVIDWVLAMSVGGMLAFTIGVIWALATQEAKMPRLLLDAVGWGVVALLYGYFIIAEGVASTTAGKRLLGLRVLDAATGQPISWVQSLKRNLLLFADLLFLGLVGVIVARANVWRQRIGDSAAGTVVVLTTERSLPVPIQHAAPVGKASRNLKVSKWAIAVLLVILALFLGLIGMALWTIVTPDSGAKIESGDTSITSTTKSVAELDAEAAKADAQAAASAAAADASPTPRPARTLITIKKPNLPAPVLDAFIAKQYPGYKVIRRVSYPDQVDHGRLSVNYLLQYKRDPRFKLVVSVAQFKPKETQDQAEDSNYYNYVGRVFTSDDTFSQEAVKLNGALGGGGTDAMIDAIVAKNPTAEMVWGNPYIDGLMVTLDGETGPRAMDLLMQQGDEDATYGLTAILPVVPGSGPVKVEAALN
jgi:uncharacterized RDD family membrane protein YckC